jgi:DNA-binding MarR family transcriptional regulator
MARAVARIRAFNRFYTALIGVVDRRILRSPYSLTEARILYEIAHDPACSARRIHAVVGVDEGYLSRTIDGLITRGLVMKRPSPDDGRVSLLSLSARGERELARLDDASAAEIGSLISGLSGDEIEELVAHMERIQALISRKEGQGNARA